MSRKGFKFGPLPGNLDSLKAMRLNCANVNFTAAFGTADVFTFSNNWLHMPPPPPKTPCPVSSFEAHFCDSSVAIHGVKSSICHKTSLTLHDM